MAIDRVVSIDSKRAADFSDFYQREHALQVRRAIVLVRSNEVANDLVHDAMIEVFRRSDSLEEPGGYLNRAVLNRCRDFGRRSQTQYRLLSTLVHGDSHSAPQEPLGSLVGPLAVQPTSRRSTALLLGLLDRRDRRSLGLPTRFGRTVDRQGVEEHEGVPTVIEVEQQVRDLCQERSQAARPDPDLRAVMSGTPRVAVTSGAPTLSRTRRVVLLAAALLIVASVGATVAAYITRPRDAAPGFQEGTRPVNDSPTTPVTTRPVNHSPTTPVTTRPANDSPGTPSTYPDAIPPSPQASDSQMNAIEPNFYALTVDGTSLRLDTGTRHDSLADSGEVAPAGSPWNQWTPAFGSIIDSDGTPPGGFYIVTCCAPGGVIWRNGSQLAAGTRMDYLLSGSAERVMLDPATSTITKGLGPTTTIIEPGAVDVSILLDGRTMGILVGGKAPVLVITDGTPTSRRVMALPSGSIEPCAVVAMQSQFVVLVGAPHGNDPCVGDRALVVNAVTGQIDAMLRLPATVRGINSDHRSRLIVVTIDGDVVLGDLQGEPSWITLLKGDYVSAGLW